MSIYAKAVHKSFATQVALHSVDLDIKDGDFVALLGPSGSGKTTLLRIIAGLAYPDSGRIFFDGDDVTNLPVQQRNIGFVFQNYALFRHMSVADNIGFGLHVQPRGQRPDKAAIAARVQELLKLVHLEDYGARFPAQLSGGQRQRVALARALARKPRFLLLDEPFGALDAKVRQDLRQSLRDIHNELGLTSIFVTHDREEAFALADRVAILNQGRIAQYDQPDALIAHPADDFVRSFLE